MSPAAPLSRRIEVGALLPGEAALTIAADVYLPDRLSSAPRVLFCLPGGAMNRGYFDLKGEGGFSFAAAMAARGFIVATLDHLGVGESSRPLDGHALTPDILTEANAIAMDAIRAELMSGSLTGRPLPMLRSIGVGHSMGAMLTAMQQARRPMHAGLVLLGFGTAGLAVALSPEEARYAGDPAGARAELVRLARLRSPDPYPLIQRSAQAREMFAGNTADPRGVEALKAARAGLLLTAGLFSMIPGSAAPECAAVGVPVFLGLGDRDIAGPPHAIPAAFTSSHDVTLLVLEMTGHAHFLFPSREHLFGRLARWCEDVPQER
ncbi:MAG: alpha/beta fold hydrolase [Proteobacteria bacterium]|nr:alpha/beta fold hydrolase [Pseudomonadota bacterium]